MLCLPVRTITSRHNPVIATFRSAERSSRADRRSILIDGVRLIHDAYRARVPLEVVAFSNNLLQKQEPTIMRLVRHLESSGVDVIAASTSVIEAMSPVRSPSGAVALAAHQPIPMDRVFERPGIVLATIGVQDPGNVGAIIRAAEAGGATGVVVTTGSAEPFGWKALRGAMGSAFRLPVVDIDDPRLAIDTARAHGATVLAAVPQGGVSLYDVDLDGPRLVLIGGEGGGLDATSSDLADHAISIPMRSEVESLNTAVAAALIVYEARRQRLVTQARRQTEERA